MSEMFDIVLSRRLTPEDLTTVLATLLPNGLRVDVMRDLSELPDEPGGLWAIVGDTNDADDWPCVLNVLVCREECGLGPYPDLRIAGRFWEVFASDSLCDTYPFVGDLDPHDPFWALACISGHWYLASTADTPLMGPYTDGKSHFPGDEKVRLVRPVELPAIASAF